MLDFRCLLAFALSLLPLPSLSAQTPLYDESKLPKYSLPKLLTDAAGKPVTTSQHWQASRRSEILREFQTHVFGTMPTDLSGLKTEVHQKTNQIHSFKVNQGAASETVSGRLREFTLSIKRNEIDSAKVNLHVLAISPAAATQPTPAFLAYNFLGNASVDS